MGVNMIPEVCAGGATSRGWGRPGRQHGRVGLGPAREIFKLANPPRPGP